MKKLGTIEEIMEAFEECAKERQELEDKINKAIEVLKEIEGCDAYIKEVLEILGDKDGTSNNQSS